MTNNTLKRVAKATLGAAALVAVASAAQAEEELNLYNWGDYINP
ncbi:MAG: hypothetical protein NXH99_28205 [Rhodobacteraceae bacterium]|nr:hypothetical protein [Paracoccaceae bacterium]